MARVLIAEDEEPVRKLLARALSMDGHSVETAADGAEALDRLTQDSPYDLLLTDIRMPVMDGIALALAAARDFPDLPIVMMTGYASEKERAQGLDRLVREVVLKPFTLDEIKRSLADALAVS
jgi:two-component system cell cycle response regulator CpdR